MASDLTTSKSMKLAMATSSEHKQYYDYHITTFQPLENAMATSPKWKLTVMCRSVTQTFLNDEDSNGVSPPDGPDIGVAPRNGAGPGPCTAMTSQLSIQPPLSVRNSTRTTAKYL